MAWSIVLEFPKAWWPLSSLWSLSHGSSLPPLISHHIWLKPREEGRLGKHRGSQSCIRLTRDPFDSGAFAVPREWGTWCAAREVEPWAAPCLLPSTHCGEPSSRSILALIRTCQALLFPFFTQSEYPALWRSIINPPLPKIHRHWNLPITDIPCQPDVGSEPHVFLWPSASASVVLLELQVYMRLARVCPTH